MDFNTIDSQSSEVVIMSPDEPVETGLVVKVVSVNDDAPKEVSDRHAKIRQNYERRGATVPTETERNMAKEVFAACIVDWTWGTGPDGEEASIGGEKPECTDENKKMMLTNFPWFYKQIIDAVRDDSRFFTRKRAKSSKKQSE